MFSTKTVYFIFVCLIGCYAYGPYGRSYRNFSLLLGIPLTDEELSFFKNLSQNYNVSFWKHPSSVFKPLHFIISPGEKDKFYKEAKKQRISLSVLLKDVQSAFDSQSIGKYTRSKTSTFDWNSYYDLTAIYGWLEDLAKKYPNEVDIQSIGKTYEKRHILAVKLFIGHGNPGSRPKVIIEGGIHGREWISPAFVTYMIKELLEAPKSNNSEIRKIATNYEFNFIPVANPDGYEFSHVHDRLWRKNRRGGYGVDLNRNFGLAFGKLDVGKLNKYSDGYCGEAPFSETETVSLAQFTRSNSENLKYYISFHSYGQHFIIPYDYSEEHLGNYEEVKTMASSALRSLTQIYGTEYNVGNAYETIGRFVSGSSTGWAKKTCKIPYVASLELRDTGQYGFALPSDQILPTCQETMECMYSFLKPYQINTGLTQTSSTPKPKELKQLKSKSSHSKSSVGHYMCLIVIIKVR